MNSKQLSGRSAGAVIGAIGLAIIIGAEYLGWGATGKVTACGLVLGWVLIIAFPSQLKYWKFWAVIVGALGLHAVVWLLAVANETVVKLPVMAAITVAESCVGIVSAVAVLGPKRVRNDMRRWR